MYRNYGDVNFFDTGVLVEVISENEFQIIKCNPDSDNENNYLLSDDVIDITDTWINKHEVCAYCGLRDFSIDYTDEEKLVLAIGVIDYYGSQGNSSWYTKNEVIDYINNKVEIEDNDFYINNFSEDNRNVVAEIYSHLGHSTKIVKDTIEDALEYFSDIVEKGDSITIVDY